MLMSPFGPCLQCMVISTRMSDSQHNHAMNTASEMHHHPPSGYYTLEDEIFSMHFVTQMVYFYKQ